MAGPKTRAQPSLACAMMIWERISAPARAAAGSGNLLNYRNYFEIWQMRN
jgi:hypothetical protein